MVRLTADSMSSALVVLTSPAYDVKISISSWVLVVRSSRPAAENSFLEFSRLLERFRSKERS